MTTPHSSFISPFRTGGDPCTFREAGELQAEIGKLTHPARPDVDWGRVESLSLALFRQNGVELQTLVCYALARTRQYGIAGMVDALDALAALISQRWGDFWPLQVHSRIALLAWLAEKMKQALRAQDLQYQDLAQINHCSQHLTEVENVLRRCEVWHMSKLEQLAVQLRNAAMRLERLAPQGEKTAAKKIARERPWPRDVKNGAKKTAEAQASRKHDESLLLKKTTESPRQRRVWPGFIAGMLTMVCLGGCGFWGWSWLNPPEMGLREAQTATSVLALPSAPERDGNKMLSWAQGMATTRAQLKRLNDLPPLWPLRQEEALLLALERRWPNNSQIKAMSAEWRKQREASALPVPDLQRYAQAQAKLRQLSLRLDALDERKGRYMTASELKSAIFSIRQLLQTPPLEEQLRQLEAQVRAGSLSPVLQMQIDFHFKQLLSRYAILLDSTEVKPNPQ